MLNSRMTMRSPIINVMSKAAIKAGKNLVRDFGEIEQLQVSRKGPADFVSAADHRSEKTLIKELSAARPGYGFLVEEQGDIPGTDPNHRWIIDPLDGTNNFLHGQPHFAISIGLEKNGEIIAGLIYNPVTDEMFCAEKGYGAYLNDKRLRVSGRQNLAEAVVSISLPHTGTGDMKQFERDFLTLSPQVGGFRHMGASALDLAYVAAGRYEACCQRRLSPWDVAAGIIMVKEAGGYVTDYEGGDTVLSTGNTVAANAYLHPHFIKMLKA